MRKVIGIIGGFSPYSTAYYYQRLNEKLTDTNNGLFLTDIIIHQTNIPEIMRAIAIHDFNHISELLLDTVKKLQGMGAQYIVLPCNTLHNAVSKIQRLKEICFIHIIQSVGKALQLMKAERCLLLGSLYTMSLDFYKCYLKTHFNMDVIVPNTNDQAIVHEIIFNELCRGIVSPAAFQKIINVINNVKKTETFSCVVLACTELSLFNLSQLSMPVIDSTQVHVNDITNLIL